MSFDASTNLFLNDDYRIGIAVRHIIDGSVALKIEASTWVEGKGSLAIAVGTYGTPAQVRAHLHAQLAALDAHEAGPGRQRATDVLELGERAAEGLAAS
jgi:hypothetical protein